MANFDHLTTKISKFWPWSWSKIFDHLTMTPGQISLSLENYTNSTTNSTIVGVIITGAAVCGGGVHSCLFKDWELILTNQISTATNQFVLFMSRFLK